MFSSRLVVSLYFKMENMLTSLVEYLVGVVIGGMAIIQLVSLFVIYYAPHRRCVAERKGRVAPSKEQPGMSVIIAAADQAEQLAKNLPHILEQDYPNFEVIVVDDNSQDDTKEVVERLSHKYSNLYMTHTSDSIRYVSHKKLALTLGIKAAKNEWVVFTEADCYPVSDQWLARLARHCTDTTDVVLAYSNYECKEGFANLCYMYDILMQQLRMLGLTLCGKGFMGIGRNMAYRCELFFTHKGYSRHLDMERGEDDLFVNEHISPQRIAADISAESVVRCTLQSAAAWKRDRLIRLFTRRKMRGMALHLLKADTITRVLFYIVAIMGMSIGIALQEWWLIAVTSIALLIYIGCRILVIHLTTRDLCERRYYLSTVLFDLIRPYWEIYFRLYLWIMPKDMHMRRKV